MYDIAVIGGGPAGLSAAIQARARSRSVLVVSGDDRDNPVYKSPHIANYLGIPDVTGPDLLARFQAHADAMGVERRTGRVLSVMPMGDSFYLNAGSDMAEARTVILATGVVRANKFAGEAERLGRGVSYCAVCDGMLYRGKSVAVIGKTTEAPSEANWLREIGCQVTYISDRHPEDLNPSIPFVKAARPEIIGENGVSAVVAGETEVPCQGVFILRSSLAPADLIPGLELEDGYLKVDRNMATNIPGVFAAGDSTGLPLQISKAVGEGQMAGHKAVDYVNQWEKDHANT